MLILLQRLSGQLYIFAVVGAIDYYVTLFQLYFVRSALLICVLLGNTTQKVIVAIIYCVFNRSIEQHRIWYDDECNAIICLTV